MPRGTQYIDASSGLPWAQPVAATPFADIPVVPDLSRLERTQWIEYMRLLLLAALLLPSPPRLAHLGALGDARGAPRALLGDDALDTDAAVAALEARTRKRGADDDEGDFRTPFAFRLVEIVLVLAADSLTLGLCNDGFANSLAGVARAILDLRAPALLVHIVPFVSKCMFQLCESENVDRYQVISILATLLAKMPDIAAVRAPVQALLETLISRCITNGDLMNLLTVLARSSVDAMSIEAVDENESDEDEDEEADAATQARALAKSKKDMRRTAIDRLPCAASIVGKVIVSSRIPGVHDQFMLCIAQSITEGDLASVLRMSRLLMAMQSVVALPPAVHSALRAVRGNVLAGNFADEANGIEPSAVAPVLETILSRVH